MDTEGTDLLRMESGDEAKDSVGDTVSFDLKGEEFSVPISVLDRYPDSLLSALCREVTVAVGANKPIKIDRDPELFQAILEIYRHAGDDVIITSAPGQSVEDLENELDFYQLPRLDDLNIALHADWHKNSGGIPNLAKKMVMEISQKRRDCFLKDRAAFLVWFQKDDLQLKATYCGVPSENFGKPDYEKNLRFLFETALRSLAGLGVYSSQAILGNRMNVEHGNLCLSCPDDKKIFPRFGNGVLQMLATELSKFGFGLKQYVFDAKEKRSCPLMVLEW